MESNKQNNGKHDCKAKRNKIYFFIQFFHFFHLIKIRSVHICVEHRILLWAAVPVGRGLAPGISPVGSDALITALSPTAIFLCEEKYGKESLKGCGP